MPPSRLLRMSPRNRNLHGVRRGDELVVDLRGEVALEEWKIMTVPDRTVRWLEQRDVP